MRRVAAYRGPSATLCATLLAVVGCSASAGGGKAAAAVPEVPARTPTAGDALFDLVPAGAALVFEIDLARLRENQVVGPLLVRLERAHAGEAASPGLALAPLALLGLSPEVVPRTDVVLMASYGLGTREAASLVIARGEGLRDYEAPGGRRLDERTVALGPDWLLERLAEVARGARSAVSGDAQLLAIRATAMPEKAGGAAVRLAAVLGFDARVELAARLDLDAVPATFALWGDVADDLAVVAILGADERASTARLARAAERWRDAAARRPAVRRLLRGYLSDLVEVRPAGDEARVVFIVGPRLLARIVRRIEAGLGARTRGEL